MPNLLRTDLNDFLFTSVADDPNGMHLTMLSALARSGVDPWAEAAGLAQLPQEDAIQRLVVLLTGLTNGPSPGDDTAKLATRLVAQLHSPPKARLERIPSTLAAHGEGPPRRSFSTLPRRIRLAIYSLVMLIVVVVGYRALIGIEAANTDDFGQQQSQ